VTRPSRQPLVALGELVERQTGIRMPPEKHSLLGSRLERRLRTLGLDSLRAYWSHLQQSGDAELTQLIDIATTNKTDFYREPAHFEYLQRVVLPKLLHAANSSRLRLWCAGCASGEEPYTLAMTLSEVQREHPGFDFRILATDISTRALAHARLGIYREAETEALPKLWRERYVALSKDRSQMLSRVRPELRSRVSFHRLNFMEQQYPVQRDFHVIFFRNVSIYFERPVQQSVVAKLASHLLRGGHLFMGHSESLQCRIQGLRSVGASIFERV
jgi:chemotaxis protein methyltransferase CheR